jgi:glucokinase-like ROK family protein
MISPVKGGNQKSIRRQNRGAVLRVILSQAPVSRLEIYHVTGMTAATVTHIVNDLIVNGFVEEVGEGAFGKVGRREIYLEISPKAARVGAIDIRLKTITVALSDLKAHMIDSITLPLQHGPDPTQTLARTAELFRELLQRNGTLPGDLLGIGVGAVGLVDFRSGINRRAASLDWNDVPIREILSSQLGVRVVVDNNVRAMALGEKLIGRGKTSNNLILLHVGWGIGSGMIINHELYRGSGYYAGEVGHMTVVPNGILCDCGNRGCLESVASGAAMVAEARRIVNENPESSLYIHTNKNDFSPIHILQAGIQGDKTALMILKRSSQYLGMAVANLINVFDPDIFVLAGSLFYSSDLYLNMVKQVAEERSYVAGTVPKTQILPTYLGAQAGIQGAAALALESFFLMDSN